MSQVAKPPVEQEKVCVSCGGTMELEKEQSFLVHEIWGSRTHPPKPANLPGWVCPKCGSGLGSRKEKTGYTLVCSKCGYSKYFASLGEIEKTLNTDEPIKSLYYYVHRKSALRVWRNAARNLVAGGGGDVVASLNPLWVELRQIMDKQGLSDWPSFEKYVLNKGDIEPFRDWIKRGLVFSATDYGTEVRETAKWLCWHNRDLLNDPEIKYGIDHPPKPDEKTEIEVDVRKMYFQVLGRHPDRGGLDNYVKLIQEGKIKREDLPKILMQSEEYAQKHFPERVRIEVPVNVDVLMNDELFMLAFMRSNYWNETKKRIDLAKLIEGFVADGFYEEFYRKLNLGELKDLRQLTELIEALRKNG